MNITELHLLWYLCGVASLTYLYLLNVGTLELLARTSRFQPQVVDMGDALGSFVKHHVKRHSPPLQSGDLNTTRRHGSESLRPSKSSDHPDLASSMQRKYKSELKGRKYLIYACQHGKYCGGLTDRLIGIITAYIGSEIMGRRFGIMMEFPCELTTFFRSNLVSWEVSTEELLNRSSQELGHLGSNDFAKRLRSYMDIYRDTDVIYYRGNVDSLTHLQGNGLLQTVSWARRKTLVDIYKIAMYRLFKHSRYLQGRYEDFKSKLRYDPSDLLCAHLRMGRSKTLPIDPNVTLTLRPNPKSVLWFLNERYNQVPADIFIATDSEQIRDMFRKEFPSAFREVKGEITHIDQGRGRHHCDGMGKAILDQFILSTCKTLVTSNSGFSRMAAIMRGSDEDLYLALPNGRIMPHRRMNPSKVLKV